MHHPRDKMRPIIRILRELSFATAAFSAFLVRRRIDFNFAILSVSLQWFCRLGLRKFVPENDNEYNARQMILLFRLCLDCLLFYLTTFVMGTALDFEYLLGTELNVIFHQLELNLHETYQLYREVKAVQAQLNLEFQQLQQQGQNDAPAPAG